VRFDAFLVGGVVAREVREAAAVGTPGERFDTVRGVGDARRFTAVEAQDVQLRLGIFFVVGILGRRGDVRDAVAGGRPAVTAPRRYSATAGAATARW